VALFDEPLHGATRDGGKFGPQKNVKAFAGQRLVNGKSFRACVHPQMALIFADSILRESVKSAEEKLFI
jgi:hypothetical protein